jgi:hypothetical protein
MYEHLDHLHAQERYADLLREAAQERLASSSRPVVRQALPALLLMLRDLLRQAPPSAEAESLLQQMM